MTADFSNLSPVSSDPAQFHGLIGVTLEGDPRLLDPSVLGGGGGGSGTVSSVGLSVPTGLAVSGSPVTTSGTIALTFAPGYGIPTTVRQSEWDAAYGDKINTATFNTTNGILTLTQQDGGTITINLDGRYLTSETDSQTLTWNGATGELSISGGNTVDLDGRYLTSFTESDPVFSASPAAGITAPQISNWDTAFGWGNHAVAGYLLSSTAATTYQPLDGDLTSIAGLAGTAGLLRKTAANSWSLDTATYLQSAEIGSTILAYDANLQSFVNTFTLPATDGTSGQVLTTNGAGILSFTTVSGGGGSSGFEIQAAVSDEVTPLTVGTNRLVFRMPRGGTLTAVRASVTTAPTGANLIVDINLNGVSILGTKLSIDVGEKTSTTAAAPATIVTSSLPDDGEITIDIDQVGATVAGAGLKVTLLVTPT